MLSLHQTTLLDCTSSRRVRIKGIRSSKKTNHISQYRPPIRLSTLSPNDTDGETPSTGGANKIASSVGRSFHHDALIGQQYPQAREGVSVPIPNRVRLINRACSSASLPYGAKYTLAGEGCHLAGDSPSLARHAREGRDRGMGEGTGPTPPEVFLRPLM